MTKQEADRWIRFLRFYGPVTVNDGMYTETMTDLVKQHKTTELRFKHPLESVVGEAIRPEDGKFTNVVITGTAGEGKSDLCYQLWKKCGGQIEELTENSPHKPKIVATPSGPVTVHFIFDLSALVPEKDQTEWNPERLELLKEFARSINGKSTAVFVAACNDGKLIHTCQRLDHECSDSEIKQMRQDLEELLASNRRKMEGRNILFINASVVKSAELYDLAVSTLISRSEWNVFKELADDPAYGPNSPLFKNYSLLKDPVFSARLRGLIELCDSNGFHIPIREILLLLVNCLLGHPEGNQRVMTASDIRRVVANGKSHLGAIHRNVFGDNLTSQKRDELRVFQYLGLCRVGQETSNEIDNLLLFGKDVPTLRPEYDRLIGSDPLYGNNAKFERLRRAYLEAEDFETYREEFLEELANERRRLFFRIGDGDEETLKVWNLTVFQSAGRYRKEVLAPVRERESVRATIIEDLVKGLNRAWSGMLIDDGTHLYITSGLDFTTSRISPVAIHKVPVRKNVHGEYVSIKQGEDGFPVLVVSLLGQEIPYRLNLLRFEFLDRVAHGSLPNSFSRECYEDVAAFKSRVLAEWYRKVTEPSESLSIIEIDGNGRPMENTISL